MLHIRWEDPGTARCHRCQRCHRCRDRNSQILNSEWFWSNSSDFLLNWCEMVRRILHTCTGQGRGSGVAWLHRCWKSLDFSGWTISKHNTITQDNTDTKRSHGASDVRLSDYRHLTSFNSFNVNLWAKRSNRSKSRYVQLRFGMAEDAWQHWQPASFSRGFEKVPRTQWDHVRSIAFNN